MKDKEEFVHSLFQVCRSRIKETDGIRQFPCNLLQLSLYAVTAVPLWGRDNQAIQRHLTDDLTAYLKKQGCTHVSDLRVKVSFVTGARNKPGLEENGFYVTFHTSRKVIVRASLVIVTGTSSQSEYPLSQARCTIGRGARGSYRGIEYANDLRFEDNQRFPNDSVSASHAHIEFDAKNSCYRLFDHESSNKTKLLRVGIRYPVDHIAGQVLLNDDEIIFGKASVRFILEEAEKTLPC